MKIDAVEAEPIFVDHAVDASITRSTELRRRVLVGPAEAHNDEQIDDDLFEERRRILSDAFQKVGP